MMFQILADQITTLFVSLNLLTTLTFDAPITSFLYGGSKDDVFMETANNSRTLAIRPKRKDIASNLLVITSKGKFYFDVRYDEKNPHQFVEVKFGRPGHVLKKVVTTNEYDIFEGQESVMFVSKTAIETSINGVKVKNSSFFSKGVPLLRDGVRIFN